MNLLENLQKLNFSKLEAQIYMALLGQEPMSAYQLAKKIEMSRPAIYNALDHMMEKGMVDIISESTVLYMVQQPEVLFDKMYADMGKSIKELKAGLETYKNSRREERTVNFRGYETAIFKAKEIMKNTEREIYINADFDLTCFNTEFAALNQKGIRIIVFSFYNIKTCQDKIEFYTHDRKIDGYHTPSRLMLVSDHDISLTADGSIPFDSWKGTVTNNILSVKIISEHIHNDIYLLKLRRKLGREMYEELRINTEFEKIRKEEEEL